MVFYLVGCNDQEEFYPTVPFTIEDISEPFDEAGNIIITAKFTSAQLDTIAEIGVTYTPAFWPLQTEPGIHHTIVVDKSLLVEDSQLKFYRVD